MRPKHPSKETEARWEQLFTQVRERYDLKHAAKATTMVCDYQRDYKSDWEPAYSIGIAWLEEQLLYKMDDTEYNEIIAAQEIMESL